MKVVRNLLLGSAAGLVAVTAAQAADLPVKARPVQYVKVCSLYGAGFYYMPGTDMCIKIGGWWSEISWGVNGNSTTGSFASDYNNRYTDNFWSRERGYITADAREQTAYGVARGYIAVGIASQTRATKCRPGQANINRAFVQWAGFTAGLSVSFFDLYPAAALLSTPATCRGRFRRRRLVGVGLYRPAWRRLLRHLSAEERRDNQKSTSAVRRRLNWAA